MQPKITRKQQQSQGEDVRATWPFAADRNKVCAPRGDRLAVRLYSGCPCAALSAWPLGRGRFLTIEVRTRPNRTAARLDHSVESLFRQCSCAGPLPCESESAQARFARP